MSASFCYTSCYYDAEPQAGRALDLWIPHGAPRSITLCFIHGGGWRQGRRDQMHEIMKAFLREGYICISLDYRIHDTADPGVQVGDVREGLAIADRLLREEHGISQPVVLYGSSAGGHLALLTALAPQGECGEAWTGEAPHIAGVAASCAAITFEPWDEIFPESWDTFCRVVGQPYAEAPELYRRFSPRQYGGAQSPPLFFLLGECEHMFPNADTIAWVEELRAIGVSADYRIYPAAEHGFFYTIERRSQQMALADLLVFLRQVETATIESPALSQ